RTVTSRDECQERAMIKTAVQGLLLAILVSQVSCDSGSEIETPPVKSEQDSGKVETEKNSKTTSKYQDQNIIFESNETSVAILPDNSSTNTVATQNSLPPVTNTITSFPSPVVPDLNQ